MGLRLVVGLPLRSVDAAVATLGDSGESRSTIVAICHRRCVKALDPWGIARGPQVTLKISLRWAHDGEGLLRSQLVFVVMAVVLPINSQLNNGSTQTSLRACDRRRICHRASLRSCELVRVGTRGKHMAVLVVSTCVFG